MRPAAISARIATLALPLTLALGCDHCNDCHDSGPATLFESEPNDLPQDADFAGTLFVGQHFFIEGFITDRGSDPFDGFAFTAGEPLHVDFQLFIDNALADLDVCLYDPLLDQTLACFATDQNPEQGGVDVTAGGLDFHLVVESFTGESSYGLEIVVLPAVALTAAPSSATDAPALRASGDGVLEGRRPAARDDYRRHAPLASAPRRVLESELSYDPTFDLFIERVRVAPR